MYYDAQNHKCQVHYSNFLRPAKFNFNLKCFLRIISTKQSINKTFLFLHKGADKKMRWVFWGFRIGVIKDSGLLGCDTALLGNWFPYPLRKHHIPKDKNLEIKCFPLSWLHLMILSSYKINTMCNKMYVPLKLFKFYLVRICCVTEIMEKQSIFTLSLNYNNTYITNDIKLWTDITLQNLFVNQ